MKEQNTHVAMPGEVFEKVMNVISSLPYNRVAGIINEVNQTARQVKQEKEKPKK